MSANEINVIMEINLNNDIPSAIFPLGYNFKNILKEQGYLWEKVMDAAFGDYQAGTFEYIMVDNYAYLPERVYILFDENQVPCGTASAWSQEWLWGEDVGFIIFVGVIPSHRGKGLGTQMVRHLCQVIKNRGQKVALLDVDSQNLSAIKSYLNAGLLPRLTEQNHMEVWKNIFTQLKIEPVPYSSEIRPPMDNPHPPRPYLLDLRDQGYDVK